jgi:hypothetical protein
MSTKTVKVKQPQTTFYDGWKVLTEHLGTFRATKFIALIREGFGDSVKERKLLWKGKTRNEIFKEIEKSERN